MARFLDTSNVAVHQFMGIAPHSIKLPPYECYWMFLHLTLFLENDTPVCIDLLQLEWFLSGHGNHAQLRLMGAIMEKTDYMLLVNEKLTWKSNKWVCTIKPFFMASALDNIFFFIWPMNFFVITTIDWNISLSFLSQSHS